MEGMTILDIPNHVQIGQSRLYHQHVSPLFHVPKCNKYPIFQGGLHTVWCWGQRMSLRLGRDIT